ncbi:MAG: PKD domain-containing protein, partial [Kiritimatiellia bacterium]
MKPTRSFSSLFRHCRWIATALLALACSWSAMGQGVTITSVRRDIYHTTPPANGTAYNTGEEVYIVLVLSDNIVSVEGTPRLRLTNLRAGQTEKYSYATYYDFFENGLIFKYVVEAGDFTDDLDVDQFVRVGTTIMVEGGRQVDYSTAASLMYATPLSDSADIAFRTIGFRGVPDPQAMTLTVQETESGVIPVTRGNTGNNEVAFTITTVPDSVIGNNFTLTPNPFAIPIDTINADLTLTGVRAQSGIVLRLHPTAYGAETGGDLLVTVNVTAGPAPTFYVESVPHGLIEGDPVATAAYVHLSRPHTAPLTITLHNSNPAGLQIVGSQSVTFPIGETAREFQVRALDGGTTVAEGSTATVSGEAPPASGYVPGGEGVFSLLNKDPVLLSPRGDADSPWVPTPGGEGFPYTFSWSGTDVPADMDKLQARVAFGDGQVTPWMDGADGYVNHTYTMPGKYTVTITMRDQDGGFAYVSGELEILPAVQVQINEYKYSSPPYPGPGNSYHSLRGLGRGTIDDNENLTTRTPLQGDYNWLIKYQPTLPAVTMIAAPETFDIDGVEYDSFFHVWIGDGFYGDMLTPFAPSTALLELGGANRQIGGVFSREFYPEDNYGDIDNDELPDAWEQLWGINFEAPNRMDNPDGDRLPRGANVNLDYPAEGNNYAPDGADFGHVLEIRGLDPGLNAPDSEPTAIIDEPGAPLMTAGWPGTDPTVPDTDGDGLDDGYEYYFWMNATVRGITGERYDPSRVIEGTIIDSATIANDFNPLIQGADDDDTDGDGLSNLEEYALGTNPIHWDTDGDGMNDGWEVTNGLDPFEDDASGNPDGDWMARDGDLRHWQVYDANGYDPRVAWTHDYYWRNRASRRAPTTVEFTNYEEHYLGRLCIEEGIMGAVPPVGSGVMTNPTSADSDDDQMPDGWELYVARDPVTQMVVIWPVSSDNFIADSALDAAFDQETDDDGLTVRQEFHAIETCEVYGFDNVNARWWNKFWPTDPWNPDTDGDGLMDGDENWAGFQYDSGYTEYIRGCRPGGMLNPCCVDTDMDYIPDAFEYIFAGEISGGEIVGGMDGTYFDSKSGPDAITGEERDFDYDGDGLENYQEYWMNAVYHFQYD